MLTTKTQEYLLFIKNCSKVDDVKHQLDSEIDFNVDCKIYNKKEQAVLNGYTTKGN